MGLYMDYVGLYWGYMGIMEKSMKITMQGLGLRST